MVGADCRASGSGTRIYPYCLYWLFGNPFSLDGYFAQARYRREGLGPSPKQCALPSLWSGWMVVSREGGRNGRRGESVNWDWYIKEKNVVFKIKYKQKENIIK